MKHKTKPPSSEAGSVMRTHSELKPQAAQPSCQVTVLRVGLSGRILRVEMVAPALGQAESQQVLWETSCGHCSVSGEPTLAWGWGPGPLARGQVAISPQGCPLWNPPVLFPELRTVRTARSWASLQVKQHCRNAKSFGPPVNGKL